MAGNILDLHVCISILYVNIHGCNEPGGWKLLATPVHMVANPAMMFFFLGGGNLQYLYLYVWMYSSFVQ